MRKDELQIGDYVKNRFTREVGRVIEISRRGGTSSYIIQYDKYQLDKQTLGQFELCLEPTSSFSPGTINTILSFQNSNQ